MGLHDRCAARRAGVPYRARRWRAELANHRYERKWLEAELSLLAECRFRSTNYARFRIVAVEVWGRLHLCNESHHELAERLVGCRTQQASEKAA